jgi:hypothetical protein
MSSFKRCEGSLPFDGGRTAISLEQTEPLATGDIPEIDVFRAALQSQPPSEQPKASGSREEREAECGQDYRRRHQPEHSNARSSRRDGQNRDRDMRSERWSVVPGSV